MDGITPTLAFAALFFGLSGNARDAANDQSAAFEIEQGSGCPTLIVAEDSAQPPSQEMWAEEFWSTASRGSDTSELLDPSWMESALIETKRSQLGGDPAAAEGQAPDPVMRRIVTTGGNLLIATSETDPCPSKP